MELDLTKETFSVKAGGQKFEIRYATMKTARSIDEKMKEAQGDEKKTEKAIFEILEAHGLPSDVAENLPLVHLRKVFEAIKGPN